MLNFQIDFDEEAEIIKSKVSGTLVEGDITNVIRPQVLKIYRTNSLVKGALIDATDFDGWDKIDELKEHFNFLKDYEERTHRIAILGDEMWKKTLQTIGLTLETKVKVFSSTEINKAYEWFEQEIDYAER